MQGFGSFSLVSHFLALAHTTEHSPVFNRAELNTSSCEGSGLGAGPGTDNPLYSALTFLWLYRCKDSGTSLLLHWTLLPADRTKNNRLRFKGNRPKFSAEVLKIEGGVLPFLKNTNQQWGITHSMRDMLICKTSSHGWLRLVVGPINTGKIIFSALLEIVCARQWRIRHN